MRILVTALICVIFMLIYVDCFCQTPSTLDSLKTVFWCHLSQQANMELMYEIGINEVEPDSEAKYATLLLEVAFRKADGVAKDSTSGDEVAILKIIRKPEGEQRF